MNIVTMIQFSASMHQIIRCCLSASVKVASKQDALCKLCTCLYTVNKLVFKKDMAQLSISLGIMQRTWYLLAL